MVNDQLVRAQKEILVCAKPLMELLAFHYCPEFLTLKEFVPEVAPVFATHKMMLSQALALLASAGMTIFPVYVYIYICMVVMFAHVLIYLFCRYQDFTG